MTEGFARTDSGRLVIRLDAVERQVLRSLAEQLVAMVAPAPANPDADPLEALVGLGDADAGPPEDPAVGRLLPDAYADDPEAASDFRRFTERGLREAKVAHAMSVIEALAKSGDKVTISAPEAESWLGLLNDLRLTLGVRLSITEERDDEDASEGHELYDWLTFVQDSLVHCLLEP